MVNIPMLDGLIMLNPQFSGRMHHLQIIFPLKLKTGISSKFPWGFPIAIFPQGHLSPGAFACGEPLWRARPAEEWAPRGLGHGRHRGGTMEHGGTLPFGDHDGTHKKGWLDVIGTLW